MVQLPLNFTPLVPQVFGTYNYTDSAQTTGVQIWYPTVTDLTVGTQVLLDTPIMSTSGSSRQTNAGTTALIFDSAAFNLARVVKGNMWCSFGFGRQVSSANGNIKVQLSKWDGTTETVITTSGGYTLDGLVISGGASIFQAINTPTTIGLGEKLRFRVWLTCGSGGGDWVAVGHNPTDGNTTDLITSASKTTIMKVGIPFRIEI